MIDPRYIQFFVHDVLGLFNERVENITQKDINAFLFPQKRFILIGAYGSGVEGVVFKIIHKQSRKVYALKLCSYIGDKTLDEFQIQKRFAQYKMAPEIFETDIFTGVFKNYQVTFGRAIMTPIHTSVRQYLKEQKSIRKLFNALKCLIYKKYILDYPQPILHGDMHIDNLIFLEDGKTIGFIDFGYGLTQQPCALQLLDCIPLVGSIKFSRCCPKDIQKKLCEQIIQLYNYLFSVSLHFSDFIRHPEGGYAYQINIYDTTVLLHSYNWVPTPPERTPLPTESLLKELFPTLRPPVVE
jgi:tRNA A-37 threonylcarbamoyl transferase component Bud32